MAIIKHEDQTITFTFFYSGRGYAWKLIKQGFRLLFKGRADLAIHLTDPRDIHMFDAAEQAGLNYDHWWKYHGQFVGKNEVPDPFANAGGGFGASAASFDPFASDRHQNSEIKIVVNQAEGSGSASFTSGKAGPV